MPKLTLVSLSYNHGPFIKQAIESFINQKTNFDYEIIISDDCSSDESSQIIKEYAEKYPNLIKPIIRDKNIGITANYLDSFSRVKSEYVAYCECDDYFTDPYKLQKQVDFLDNHKDHSICFHSVRMFYEDESKKSTILPSLKDLKNKTTFFLEDLIKTNFIPSNSVVYRWRFNNKNIYETFPDNIMSLDWFMHILHAEKGKIGFINETMSDYRKHSSGTWYNGDTVYKAHGFKFLNLYKLIYEKFPQYKNSVIKEAYNIYLFNEKNHLKEENIILLKTFPELFIQVLELIKILRFKKRLLVIYSISISLICFVLIGFLLIK